MRLRLPVSVDSRLLPSQFLDPVHPMAMPVLKARRKPKLLVQVPGPPLRPRALLDQTRQAAVLHLLLVLVKCVVAGVMQEVVSSLLRMHDREDFLLVILVIL